MVERRIALLVGSYGHTSLLKQPLSADSAPVMGASLLPHKRVPIAVPTALMHRSEIPKLADADTVPEVWICLIIARIPKLVCALLAPEARDRKTPSVICKTQQDVNKGINSQRNFDWNKLIEMGGRQTWPAWYGIWLLIKLTPEGVVFSLLDFSGRKTVHGNSCYTGDADRTVLWLTKYLTQQAWLLFEISLLPD